MTPKNEELLQGLLEIAGDPNVLQLALKRAAEASKGEKISLDSVLREIARLKNEREPATIGE